MPTLIRNVRAEAIRLAGFGPWLCWVLPLAVFAPLLISFTVAAIAERIAKDSAILRIQGVTSDNAAYWVVHLGVLICVIGAALAQTSTTQLAPVVLLHTRLQPRSLHILFARWLLCGAVACLVVWLDIFLLLVLLPQAFGQVYAGVDLFSFTGARLLWAGPVWTWIACGFGIGLGAVLRTPAATIAVLSVWALLIENAIALLPHGGTLLKFMPFLNGTFATGQAVAIEPGWGHNGALLYVVVLALLTVVVGALVSKRN
ncbi:hypothetical protein [Corynebacterium pelargi]|uniref:Uncharacterized protein n=1 Tax=Corynebacterium pelargi TaxID=1471400 RepID=A0A410W796_9CORY|nr:hypothetical protein [Corynebacterium pelargi]QAU51717.1 hypothetical protein CPELA_02095 [Corynebacterium pelargi]GGG80722.1 ABC transporter [Corynebacterium pelargi]